MQYGKLVENTPGEDVVVDAHGNKTPFSAFKTLLPPNNISNMLVNFLSNVFNSKAISGRLALTTGNGELAALPSNVQEFLSACDEKHEQVPQMIVRPYDTETVMIDIVISVDNSTVIAYNWLGDLELTFANGYLMVRNMFLPILYRTRLTRKTL